jgi:hypothetical protein
MKGKLRRSVSSEVPDDILQLNGCDIPFVNNVTYLGITSDRRITRRGRIERTVTKALRMYVRPYSLFKSGLLSTNITLTLHKALIRSVMTYACSTWEHAADALLVNLQHLQNRAFCAFGNFDTCTPVLQLYVAFKIPYIYYYIRVNKLYRKQPELSLNHVNPNASGIG